MVIQACFGEIEDTIGNERELLKMTADIAAVTLLNQIMLNEAQHWANTDSLTGLNNRNYFFKMSQYHMVYGQTLINEHDS